MISANPVPKIGVGALKFWLAGPGFGKFYA